MHRTILSLLATLAFASAACGGIQTLTGEIHHIAPPASVLENVTENNIAANLFAEKQNYTLTAPLSLSISTSGVFDLASKLTPSTLPAGTTVNSYFVHADTNNKAVLEGRVGFGEQILGVIVTASDLQASHPWLGLPSVTYPSNVGTDAAKAAMELKLNEERLEVNLTGGVVEFVVVRDVLFTSNIYDGFRIVTSTIPVPEPSALLVALAGCLGGFACRR